MIRLVLASASPRRRALLAALGVEFEAITGDAPEIDEGESPARIVEDNAARKRDAVVSALAPPAVVIAADTLVFLDEHVLSKPADAAEARAMLARLSGRTHQVLTGIAVVDTASGRAVQGHETTDVTFRDLTPDEIARFVEIVNPLDRAGAYTVDGPGSLLVARYDGCYMNVLGLPVVRLDLLLREVGVNLFDRMHPDRATFL
ncbi:MAG TPA: Maf family protein [Candidatus Hydrogenedentes bacterium]|nr:Maf family protein [Candidatus Hydrogenedentota bacterium]